MASFAIKAALPRVSIRGSIRVSHCWRSFSSKRSPYSVLGVRPSSTVDEIKAAFRKLAKQHHPDLNPDADGSAVSDIVAAYETLMDPHDIGGIDSRVAIACEAVSSLEELSRAVHNVYKIQVLFAEEEKDDDVGVDVNDDDCTGPQVVDSGQVVSEGHRVWRIVAHEDDSISDIKHSVQQEFGTAFGFTGRRRDRYGLATGWELVIVRPDGLEVLGNHWFLHTYGFGSGDFVHAVVRKSDV